MISPVSRPVEVPEAVRRTATAAGAAGTAWLDQLGMTITALEEAWEVEVGATFEGGTASLVAEATRADGTPAVLKLALPSEYDGERVLDTEVRALRLADGHGCVRVLAHDPSRDAVLLERLGGQLHERGLAVRQQIEVICAALRDLWSVPVGDADLPSVEAKGRWLADFIVATDEELGHPCSRQVIDRAVAYADRRVAACGTARAVLLHGDAHAWNTLEDPGAGPDAYRLVDADGLLGEPEYDLAIPMREFTDELLAGDALRIGLDRARFLADHTGLEEQRIWEWGYVERVSTGLLCQKEGHADCGRDFLLVAEAWSLGPA
jgi:streptomycin 6-kinase